MICVFDPPSKTHLLVRSYSILFGWSLLCLYFLLSQCVYFLMFFVTHVLGLGVFEH